MTKEEAMQILRANVMVAVDRAGFSLSCSKMVEGALDMAIKALEQESVLDKIKAEIEAKCCITVGRENDGAITLHDVFEIIDKYKTESEDKE